MHEETGQEQDAPRTFLVRDDTRDLRRVSRDEQAAADRARESVFVSPPAGPYAPLPPRRGSPTGPQGAHTRTPALQPSPSAPTSQQPPLPGQEPARPERATDPWSSSRERVAWADGARHPPSPPQHNRRLALARALAAEGGPRRNGHVPPSAHADSDLHAALVRLAGYRGVRLVCLLTRDGHAIDCIADNARGTAPDWTVVASLCSLSDLALAGLDAGKVDLVTASTDSFRIEVRRADDDHLLAVALDEALPHDRLRPVIDVALEAVREALPPQAPGAHPVVRRGSRAVGQPHA